MCCFYDSKTRRPSFLNAATDRNYLETLFKKYTCDLVVMEACGPSGWINDLAIRFGHKTLVCSSNTSNEPIERSSNDGQYREKKENGYNSQ